MRKSSIPLQWFCQFSEWSHMEVQMLSLHTYVCMWNYCSTQAEHLRHSFYIYAPEVHYLYTRLSSLFYFFWKNFLKIHTVWMEVEKNFKALHINHFKHILLYMPEGITTHISGDTVLLIFINSASWTPASIIGKYVPEKGKYDDAKKFESHKREGGEENTLSLNIGVGKETCYLKIKITLLKGTVQRKLRGV
jgi:hypothetical protein